MNAIAVRTPANTPAPAGSAAATPAPNEPVTAESLGWQLKAALPPMRLHSVSLYDEEANVLWLSEGALGPDEHNVVVEAIDALGTDTPLTCYESGMEDGRIAIFLPVRAPHGALVGLAMILADVKSVGDGFVEKMLTPQTRTIMQRIAVLLRPAQPTQASVPPQARLAQTDVVKVLELAPEKGAVTAASKSAGTVNGSHANAKGAKGSPRSAAATATASPTSAAPAAAAAPILSPQAVDDILEFELTPGVPAVAPVSQSQRLKTLSPSSSAASDMPVASAELPASLLAPPAAAAGPIAPPVTVAAPAVAAAELEIPVDVPVLSAANVAQATAGAPDVVRAPHAGAVGSSGVVGGAASRAVGGAVSGTAGVTATGAAGSGASVATAGAGGATGAGVAGIAAGVAAATAGGVTAGGGAAGVATAVAVGGAAAGASGVTAGVGAAGAAGGGASVSATGVSATLTGTSKGISAATGTSKSLSATSTSRVLTLTEGMTLTLDVQPFSKLRSGGRTRRYEVLARSSQPNRVPAGFDKIALQQLLTWMGQNRGAWNLEPTSFTLNLSIATLEDERFPQFVASNLKTHGIAPDNIGFEIAEPLCLQRRAQVERFITLCDKLGCFVVIDDFSLDSSIVSLLRSKALRLVKIDPKLTSVALKDKLAQAMVVAIAQAVKVLGIHCAAKRVDSQASLQWLTAIGCDFAQGPVLAQVQPLDGLGSTAARQPA